MLVAFNESNAIKEILLTDASKGMADLPLGTPDLNLIDSFVKVDNMEMVRDSIKRAEGAQGKYIFSYALKKFSSKWLDSLAKARYAVYKMEDKEAFIKK